MVTCPSTKGARGDEGKIFLFHPKKGLQEVTNLPMLRVQV